MVPHRGRALGPQPGAGIMPEGHQPVPQPMKPSSLLSKESAGLSGFHQNREATVFFGNIVSAVLFGLTGLSHSNWVLKNILSKNLNARGAQKRESKLGCSYLCNLMENEDERLWKLSTISCMFKKISNKINRVSRNLHKGKILN